VEALFNRLLPKNYPKVPELEKELARRRKGFRDDRHVDYPLTLLPKEKNYFIKKDIRLEAEQKLYLVNPPLDKNKIRKLKKLLIKHNQPVLSHIIEQYGI